jgi:hypothetical protein
VGLTTFLFGFIWLLVTALLWTFHAHDGQFALILGGLIIVLVAFVAWFRRQVEPPEPPRSTKWRAFAILNAGKDLLRGNKPFVKIEFTNPKLLDEIRRLNGELKIS